MSTTPNTSNHRKPFDPKVVDLFAFADRTTFTVEQDTGYNTDVSRWSAMRINTNSESILAVRACEQESRITIPDAVLDTVIRSLENLRDARNRSLEPTRFSGPLVADEPYDPRVAADAGGAFIADVFGDDIARDDLLKGLDARNDEGQAAA